jgi:hypothetical protein
VKAKVAGATTGVIGCVHILEKLSLVLDDPCVLKTCAVLKPGNITSKHTGPAAMKATDKHMLKVGDFAIH